MTSSDVHFGICKLSFYHYFNKRLIIEDNVFATLQVPIRTCVTKQWRCVRMALNCGLRELKPASRGLFQKNSLCGCSWTMRPRFLSCSYCSWQKPISEMSKSYSIVLTQRNFVSLGRQLHRLSLEDSLVAVFLSI